MALTFDELVQAITPAEMQQQLLNSLQGVTPVTQNGVNSGAIVGTGFVLAQGPAIASSSVVIAIESSGQVGVATFQFSLDGGNTWSSVITVPSNGIYQLTSNNITLTFENGLSTPQGGSFQVGETYTFQTSIPNFPITNWGQGSPPMGFVKMERDSLSDLSTLITQIAAGGLVMSWITPPAGGPPPSGWLDLLAQNVYQLQRVLAQYAQGNVMLTCATGAGPYTITLGTVLCQSVQGQNFYVSALPNGATLPSGGTLVVQVQAQQAGMSYNTVQAQPPVQIPGANYIQTLLTPLAGVTVSNPLQGAQTGGAPVFHAGIGGGVVTYSGTPTALLPVIISITATGVPGVGSCKVWTNGGQGSPFYSGVIPTGALAVGSGMVLNFAGSFLYGDSYSSTTDWFTQYGSDAESNFSLATRCVNQWPSLSPGSPAGVYSNWAKAASAEVVSVASFPDPVVPGQIDVILAGANEQPVSSAAIAAVTTYISARVPEGVKVLVQSISQLVIAITVGAGGGIYVLTAQLAAAQAAIAAALQQKQVSIGAGGVVEYSQLLAICQNANGVDHIDGFLVNGGTADLQLLQFQAASFTPPPGSAYVVI